MHEVKLYCIFCIITCCTGIICEVQNLQVLLSMAGSYNQNKDKLPWVLKTNFSVKDMIVIRLVPIKKSFKELHLKICELANFTI